MNHTVTALGWTLIHFLWQGAGIAALFAGARYALRKSSAQSRYAAAMAAMLLMLACAAATFVYLNSGDTPASQPPNVTQSPIAVVTGTPAAAQPAAASWRDRIPDYFPALVYIWIAGVLCLSIRSFGGWVAAQRWKRSHVRPADAFWQERMAHLAKRLAISRTVRLWNSAVAQTPAVIGWIRPVVLLPASALSGLEPGQIEALLAHELAHIRRHDYLINLLQTAVETLLFYHPAVWWVGRKMRAERENCCDDLAVAVCGDALVYARALTELEQIRMAAPRLAMAANDGSLLDRVRRLLDSENDPARKASANHGDWFTVAAITLSAVSIWAISRAPMPRHGYLAPAVHLQNVLYRETPESGKRQSTARPQPQVRLIAMTQTAEQDERATPGAKDEQSFLDGIAALGYKDLSVDQIISLKIHAVTSGYIRQLLAAGLKLKVDELVSFAIHGANPADIVEMQKLGYKLTPDEIVSMQIHGLTPAFTRQMAAEGWGAPTIDQLIAFKIHGVTPEIAAEFKQAGVRELTFDNLVALQIHGANPDSVKQIAALGYPNLAADDVVRMCIHGVDADYVRKAAKHGFKDLPLEKLIQLKQFGILD